jgi:RimJ/RimL family protein N-acetyltransferase
MQTTRLTLRPFELADAPVIKRLAGVPEVALTTQNIPYPYQEGVAEAWMAGHGAAWDEGSLLTLAVSEEEDGLVGAVSLRIDVTHRRGELGYWVGVPFWNRGFATEAAGALLQFGFGELGLNRIQARHMTRNPSSGRVTQKLGMSAEGIQRQHIVAHGKVEDIAMCAILRAEWGEGAAPYRRA